MGAYASNVIDVPGLRHRQRVFRDRADALQRLLALLSSHHGAEPDAIVYAGDSTRALGRGLANHLDLPCLKLGSGIRELVRGRNILLVSDSLANLESLTAAVDWLLAFKVQRLTLAAPTGHRHAIDPLANVVHSVICPNIRCSWNFASADAYADASATPAEPLERALRAG